MIVNRKTLFISLTLGSIALVGVFALVYPRITGSDQPVDLAAPVEVSTEEDSASLSLSKAVLSVQGLTCSSCIQEVKSVLFQNPTVKKVFVDVERGKAQVYLTKGTSRSLEKMAQDITASGYPAVVEAVMTPQEVQKDLADADILSRIYVASIDGWEIPRAEFETEVNAAMLQYRTLYGEEAFAGANGQNLTDNLKVQCLNRLVDEAIMLQEVSRAGFTGKKDPDIEFRNFLDQNGFDNQSLKSNIESYGYQLPYFRKKFDNMVLIEDYLESRVLAKAATTFEREKIYNEWFANASSLVNIKYYDTELEALQQNTASAGSCCPTE